MATFTRPTERREFQLDADGIPFVCQHEDEVKTHTIDWSDSLASGETISSSSWDSGGVTLSGATSGTTSTTVTVTGTDGFAENTVVTSASRTLVQALRFRPIANANWSDDYGNR